MSRPLPRILFVCLGNICRSPSAEGVMRDLALAAGLDLVIDSAGTGGWHAGEPPHPPMARAAKARGHDLSRLRARQVRAADFSDFDMIFAMDRDNLADLQALAARAGEGKAELRLFLDLTPECGIRDVPDPWYTGEFDRVIDLAEAACARLIEEITARR